MRIVGSALISAALLCAGCSHQAQPVTANDVLLKNQEAMLALTRYSADCYSTITFDPPRNTSKYEISHLTAEKPNRMRYDLWRPATTQDTLPTTTPSITFACDGTTKFEQFGHSYRQDPRTSPDAMSTLLEPWRGFYSPSGSILGLNNDIAGHDGSVQAKLDGEEKVGGVSCDKVTVTQKSTYEGETVEETDTFFIGKDDHLVRRAVSHV